MKTGTLSYSPWYTIYNVVGKLPRLFISQFGDFGSRHHYMYMI